MRTTLLSILFASALVAAASGCGGPPSSPYAGTYLLDADRTFSSNPTLAAKPSDATLARLREAFGPDDYRLVVEGDGSYRLHLGDFAVSGTWTTGDQGLEFTTSDATTEAGEAAPLPSAGHFEGEHLVLESDGRLFYLRRS